MIPKMRNIICIIKSNAKEYSFTFPSSSLISKFTSKTYIKLRDSEMVFTDPVIISIAEVTELLMERGTL